MQKRILVLLMSFPLLLLGQQSASVSPESFKLKSYKQYEARSTEMQASVDNDGTHQLLKFAYKPKQHVQKAAVQTMKLYPNPSQGQLQVEFRHTTSGRLSILDMLGKQVYQMQWSESRHQQIQLPEIPSGLYAIIFQNEKEVISEKFLKQ
ncbi:MAG: T9SS type A sorting domain-containing protein [Flavobacteriales bacterium]